MSLYEVDWCVARALAGTVAYQSAYKTFDWNAIVLSCVLCILLFIMVVPGVVLDFNIQTKTNNSNTFQNSFIEFTMINYNSANKHKKN